MKTKITYLIIWVILLLITSCGGGEYTPKGSKVLSYDTLGHQIVGCCTVIYKIRVDDRVYLVSSKGGIVFHQNGYR